MRQITPFGVFLRGMAAGAVGSALLGYFFKATARLAPAQPPQAFIPPEEQQAHEQATETMARRLVEKVALNGPLSEEKKRKYGRMIRFAFGASWGGLYGLLRESLPVLRNPLGTLGFTHLVWLTSNHLLLPAFKLGAKPANLPMKNHFYAWLAHLVYGLGLWSTYQSLRPQTRARVAALLWLLGTRRKLHHLLPDAAMPVARPLISALAALKAYRPNLRAALDDLRTC